ncbi:hypothetical protein FIBSPDRAFT_846628 [Athelia psychrophila]|uniref:Uncharacterized protein n=1 Tax=Athelia psychrophila TaxID=1759441 RepID=A0A166X7K9_9AGAM|nr:hypothetical protein FIBSPDRAFT_846628 [Fibularhizoctonia sp. CBS 109695]
MHPINDSPPSYDLATASGSEYAGTSTTPNAVPVDRKSAQSKAPAPTKPQPFRPPTMPEHTVYHYVHPVTNQHVASLLPPNHPQMICLQEGRHVPHTRFGVLGLLAAVFWFPLGIGLCLLDRKTTCSRCGLRVDEGLL